MAAPAPHTRARAQGVDASLGVLTQHLQSSPLAHKVVVDCTASSLLPRRYRSWLERGLHVVTPNKRLNSGPLGDYLAVRALTRAGAAHYMYEVRQADGAGWVENRGCVAGGAAAAGARPQQRRRLLQRRRTGGAGKAAPGERPRPHRQRGRRRRLRRRRHLRACRAPWALGCRWCRPSRVCWTPGTMCSVWRECSGAAAGPGALPGQPPPALAPCHADRHRCTSSSHSSSALIPARSGGFPAVPGACAGARTCAAPLALLPRAAAFPSCVRFTCIYLQRAHLPAPASVPVLPAACSGTLSYIFNELAPGRSFSDVVWAAKRRGYTEPDPRDDLSGARARPPGRVGRGARSRACASMASFPATRAALA
jgi:hypothetical protein